MREALIWRPPNKTGIRHLQAMGLIGAPKVKPYFNRVGWRFHSRWNISRCQIDFGTIDGDHKTGFRRLICHFTVTGHLGCLLGHGIHIGAHGRCTRQARREHYKHHHCRQKRSHKTILHYSGEHCYRSNHSCYRWPQYPSGNR